MCFSTFTASYHTTDKTRRFIKCEPNELLWSWYWSLGLILLRYIPLTCGKHRVSRIQCSPCRKQKAHPCHQGLSAWPCLRSISHVYTTRNLCFSRYTSSKNTWKAKCLATCSEQFLHSLLCMSQRRLFLSSSLLTHVAASWHP